MLSAAMGITAKTRVLLTAAMAALAAAPTAAADPGISEQPADTVRTEVTRMEWLGEAPGQTAPQVSVEYRHGLSWVTETRPGAGNLLVAYEGDGVWSARWQPTRYNPTGTYRIRVGGVRQTSSSTADVTLVSDVFSVQPCACVIPGLLRSKWRKGKFRIRLTAEYAPASRGQFRLLPAAVRTGRPLVRVLRDGRRVGSVRLRYARGAFRGTWRGPRGPRHSVVFELVSLTDGFGNS